MALVILVVAGFRRGYHLEGLITPRHFVRLGFILATLSATYIYLTFADLLPGAYVADRGTAAVFTELLVGRLALWFWLFAIVGGLLPLLLVALPWTRNVPGHGRRRPPRGADDVAQTDPHGRRPGHLRHRDRRVRPLPLHLGPGRDHPRRDAAIPLLLMLLFRVVPLLSIDEIEEIAQMQEIDEMEKDLTAHPHGTGDRPHGLAGRRRAGPPCGRRAGVLLLVALLGMLG